MRTSFLIFLWAALLLLGTGCGKKDSFQYQNDSILLNKDNAGEFAALAIKEVHSLDIVFYPSGLLADDQFAFVTKSMGVDDVELIKSIYPQGKKDQFLLGALSGRRIKDFVEDRISLTLSEELQVAGLRYHFAFIGGRPSIKAISLIDGTPLQDDTYYSVAVNHYFFGMDVFPGYKFGNNLSQLQTEKIISATQAIEKYSFNRLNLPLMVKRNSKVEKKIIGQAGNLKISQVQGISYISPYLGKMASVEGVITAIAMANNYPFGVDIIIESTTPDQDDRSSEGLRVYLQDPNIAIKHQLKTNQKIRVTGTIYERFSKSQLSITGIWDVTQIEVLKEDASNELPPPIAIGTVRGERKIPTQVFSSYVGDLNNKKSLLLTDALDFYESLESMRIQFHNPKVLGFRGGLEDNLSGKAKGYLNLFVRVDGDQPDPMDSPVGGLLINVNETQKDFNPEIMTITTHHLASGVNQEGVYNVGQLLESTFTGIFSYEKNLFGEGEYVIFLTPPNSSQNTLEGRVESNQKEVTPLDLRPKSQLIPDDDHLTVATYNVENLAGNEPDRFKDLGKIISITLHCPDIINLVEIQDLNGVDFSHGPSANETLESILPSIKCQNSFKTNYQFINIDPISHQEGGKPGGNIRVAMIYNQERVQFRPKDQADADDESIIGFDGHLRKNPGRVYPTDPTFNHTRKSLVAEFEFKGKTLFVIGNHFNSKLGDSSFYSNKWPIRFRSEIKRSDLASKIHNFVAKLTKVNPKAGIIVLGDFNAHMTEYPMKVLEGTHLKNLFLVEGLIPPNERYTTNYNGNSQSLDYILANDVLLKSDPKVHVPHINSDFMGRFSDHDPVVAQFRF